MNMHSMHPHSVLAEHEPLQVQAQVQQQQQQQMQHEEQTAATITVLESLNPSQPQPAAHQVAIGGGSEQQQHNNNLGLNTNLMGGEAHLVQQHLVQSNGGQQPHLHQLQPSHGGATNAAQALEAANQSQQMLVVDQSQASAQDDQQVQQHQQQGNQQANNLLRQRPQIEGIVAEGGGPIVQWLLDNYEIADGESLPRSTVYNHYLSHCRQLQMASVNAASFGKLIRSVFVGLKTRRLGTRGHSKYHYFGVRAKQHIQQELLQHQDSNAGCSMLHQNNENSNQTGENGSESDSTGNGLECGRLSSGSSSNKRLKRSSQQLNGAQRRQQMYHHNQQQAEHLKLDQQQHQQHHHQQQQQQVELNQHQQAANGSTYQQAYQSLHHNNTNGFNGGSSAQNKVQMINNSGGNDERVISMEQHCELADFRNHLGANWATLVDEHWPQRDPTCSLERQLLKTTTGNNADLTNLLDLFEIKYKIYYKRMVEFLSELKFLEVEQVWMEFWQADQEQRTNNDNQQWCSAANAATTTTGDQTVTSNQQNGLQQQHQQHSASDIVHQHLDYQQQQQHTLTPQEQQQQQQVNNLAFHQLYQLTSLPAVVERINQIDYSLFAAIESFLLPDMLSPIPRPLAQHIRLFAKNFGPWIEMATKDYEPQFAADKSKSARAFGYALRRYTSLNHLSTASRAIWEKRSSLAQMSIDLSRVDLRDIEHQVSLMSRDGGGTGTGTGTGNEHTNEQHPTARRGLSADDAAGSTKERQASSNGGERAPENNDGSNSEPNNLLDLHCDHHHHNNNGDNQQHRTDQMSNNHQNQNQNQNRYIHHPHHLCVMQPAQLIQNFLHLLEDPYPANSWPDWCRNLVDSRVCGRSIEEARNFVLKWNFYISLIMKELTLRSAPSFGSFQLIRLLFDEYIFYLVVTRLAQAQHKTPAQLLGM